MAQNPTCPTRPVNDDTNACASTAFVQNQLSAGGASFTQGGTGAITRTPQNKMREWVSANDYGTGTTAWDNAATYVGSTGLFTAPNGSYTFGTIAPGQAGILGYGAQISSGTFPGAVDFTIMNKSSMWFYRNMADAGSGVTASANQFGIGLFGMVPVTGSAAGYEKATLAISNQCADPSVFGSIARDCVGIDIGLSVPASNTQASTAAGNFKIHFDGDGAGTGLEVDIFNNAGTVGPFGGSKSKAGYTAFAYGAVNSSAGFAAGAGTKQWLDGFLALSNGIVNNAFVLRDAGTSDDLFKVSPSGFITVFQNNNGGINQYTIQQSGATGSASILFLHTAIQAWQAGLDGADNTFRISAAQDAAWSSTIAKFGSNGLANFTGWATLGTATLTQTMGSFGLTKITASASAPGAAGGKIELVCGTNAGTAKLVAYAGTSGTAVTITDNIGAGVSGC